MNLFYKNKRGGEERIGRPLMKRRIKEDMNASVKNRESHCHARDVPCLRKTRAGTPHITVTAHININIDGRYALLAVTANTNVNVYLAGWEWGSNPIPLELKSSDLSIPPPSSPE